MSALDLYSRPVGAKPTRQGRALARLGAASARTLLLTLLLAAGQPPAGAGGQNHAPGLARHCEEAAGPASDDQAIRQTPWKRETLIGTCYFRGHDFEPAVEYLKKAVQEAPGDKEATIFLGRAYASAGVPEEGIRILKNFQTRQGDDPDILYWIGAFYDQLAEQTYQTMAKSHPDSYLVLETQGDQFLQQQKYDEALRAYQKALSAAPSAPGVHFDVGNTYWRMAKLDQAAPELEAELRLNPDDAQANYELGDIAIKQGDVTGGLALLKKALALDPSLVEAHKSLGRGLLAERRYAEAVSEFSVVAKAQPADHTIHALLANAYQRMGLTKEAEAETRKYNELVKQQMNDLARKEAAQNQDATAAPGGPEN
ncbi:MAG TPA: tetratricopeptide repeat protein [Terriglobia bacterium]